MFDLSHALYLFNPHSNEERARETWQKARRIGGFLPEEPVDITQVGNLSEYLREHSPELVVVAGGDGTVNAVCQAVLPLEKKPVLAVIPMGFGNALAYCLGVETIEKALSVLQRQQYEITIDLMKTSISKYPVGFFNIGVGFDARIVHSRMNYRYIGLRSYVISAIRSFFYHTDNKIRFTIDRSVVIDATASSLVIANSPIIGQNYVISDYAKLNDGLLDCTLFSTKYAYLTNLRLRGFKHPLYSEQGKVHFKAKHIKIEGEPYIQVDGDPTIHNQASLEVEVIPKQVTFLRNGDEQIKIDSSPFE